MTGVRRLVCLAAAGVCCIGLWLAAAEPARCEDVTERLSMPGPITLGDETYRLAWSSHPSPDYYKQEYLPAGQSLEHFERMLLVEALVGYGTVEAAVGGKVATLNRRKASDPLVNFALLKNPKTGEVILDFVLGAPDTKARDIVEWNAYRYSVLKGKGGSTAGVLLIGISRRAYGDGTTEFLRVLKSSRPPMIDALAKYPLPVVRVTP